MLTQTWQPACRTTPPRCCRNRYITDAFQTLLTTREQYSKAASEPLSLRTAGYMAALRRLERADMMRGHS
jgi:glutamate dehydrogenase (NAD(P)+)